MKFLFVLALLLVGEVILAEEIKIPYIQVVDATDTSIVVLDANGDLGILSGQGFSKHALILQEKIAKVTEVSDQFVCESDQGIVVLDSIYRFVIDGPLDLQLVDCINLSDTSLTVLCSEGVAELDLKNWTVDFTYETTTPIAGFQHANRYYFVDSKQKLHFYQLPASKGTELNQQIPTDNLLRLSRFHDVVFAVYRNRIDVLDPVSFLPAGESLTVSVDRSLDIVGNTLYLSKDNKVVMAEFVEGNWMMSEFTTIEPNYTGNQPLDGLILEDELVIVGKNRFVGKIDVTQGKHSVYSYLPNFASGGIIKSQGQSSWWVACLNGIVAKTENSGYSWNFTRFGQYVNPTTSPAEWMHESAHGDTVVVVNNERLMLLSKDLEYYGEVPLYGAFFTSVATSFDKRYVRCSEKQGFPTIYDVTSPDSVFWLVEPPIPSEVSFTSAIFLEEDVLRVFGRKRLEGGKLESFQREYKDSQVVSETVYSNYFFRRIVYSEPQKHVVVSSSAISRRDSIVEIYSSNGKLIATHRLPESVSSVHRLKKAGERYIILDVAEGNVVLTDPAFQVFDHYSLPEIGNVSDVELLENDDLVVKTSRSLHVFGLSELERTTTGLQNLENFRVSHAFLYQPFPNPVATDLRIEMYCWEDPNGFEYYVVNSNGRKMQNVPIQFDSMGPKAKSTLVVDCEGLQAGVYIVVVESASGNISARGFVVQ